jgi:hypothetical protein
MIDDPVLIDDWHPVALVAQLADGGPIAAQPTQVAMSCCNEMTNSTCFGHAAWCHPCAVGRRVQGVQLSHPDVRGRRDLCLAAPHRGLL